MSQTLFYFALTAVVLKCALAITNEQKLRLRENFISIGTKCILNNPITIEDVKSIKNKEFPEGANAGCFLACIFNKAGIFDEEGTLSQKTAVEKAATILDDDTELNNLQQFITTCEKVNDESVTDGEKGCERAKLAFECLIENSEQFGFNFDF